MKLNKFFHRKKNFYSIFLFHGVIKNITKGIRNYNNKHMLENKFVSILRKLKEYGHCISMDELIYFRKKNINLKKNTFLITFDDGFENNYSVAAPILDDLKLPALFYFSTEFVENNSMSWTDKVEHCLQETKNRNLKLPWIKKLISIKNNNDKIIATENIRKYIKSRLEFDIPNFLDNLFDQLKINNINNTNYEIDKKINWKKINNMRQNKLFSFGGHSHLHKSLASFDDENLKNQINLSLSLFKKKSQINLKYYSYPEGMHCDFNSKIIKNLKIKKIKSCPTAIPGYNNITDDLFRLKRISL